MMNKDVYKWLSNVIQSHKQRCQSLDRLRLPVLCSNCVPLLQRFRHSTTCLAYVTGSDLDLKQSYDS